MGAKEMFEKLGYECFDDRKRQGLPLTILYRDKEMKMYNNRVIYFEFNLVDKCWSMNKEGTSDEEDRAIKKQIEELGWNK